MRYGIARAGGLSSNNPCTGPFNQGIGGGCGGSDWEAWQKAGAMWVEFTKELVKRIKYKYPGDQISIGIPLIESNLEKYPDTFWEKPWLNNNNDVLELVQAQQYFRNVSSEMADFLESKKEFIPQAPADIPEGVPTLGSGAMSFLKTAAIIGGLIVGGTILINLSDRKR